QPVLEQTAWGIAGTPTKIDRTVKVVMSDSMRFEPSSLQFKEGETVKFIVKNGRKTDARICNWDKRQEPGACRLNEEVSKHGA
ncbi:[similarity to] blue (type1) copper domain-containing protein, partial [methanotrophic bacterial endosymbiont of Bathymodiolus sp.]